MPTPDLLPVDPLAVLRERRSAKWRQHPPDVLPLTVAEMDVGLAPPVREALAAALARDDSGYAWPVPDLGRALAAFAGERWGWAVDPDQVTAVPDVGVGVVEVLRALVRPGDAVAFSPPVYPPFFDWLPEAGVRTVEVPLVVGVDGRSALDLPALERAFAGGVAAYLLCNPHNPVGTVPTCDELTALVAVARRYDVTIVADEIHAPLVLPGTVFTPVQTVPGAPDVAVSVASASKGWNLAAFKCAAVVTGSPAMRAVADRFPTDLRWRPGHFGVLATVAAYTEGGPWLDRLLATLVARRSLLGELLATRLPGVRWRPPDATFLAWLDCREVLGEGTAPYDAFLERGRVALDPGPHYGAPGSGFVRLNYATSAEILDAATAAMGRVIAGS